MMQQLAAKQSDIAALDIGKRGAHNASDAHSKPDNAFTDIIRRVSPNAASDSDRQHRQVEGRANDTSSAIASQRKTSTATAGAHKNEKHTSLPDNKTTQHRHSSADDDASVEQLSKEQNADVDWLAYVDAVQSAEEKLGEHVEATDDTELTDEETLLAQAMLAMEEFDGKSLSKEDVIKLEDASGRAFTTPVTSVIESMMAQLSQQEGETGHSSDELKGLAGVLLTSQQQGKISLNSDSVLTKLAEALPDASEQGMSGELIAKALAKANAESGDGEHSEGEQALFLSLLQNEINAAKQGGGESVDKAAQLSELSTSRVAQDNLSELMQDMQDLSQSSAEEVTEALSSNIVALMPNASAEQQQTVKSALVSAINEIQQQLAKGNEPGLDLKSVIQQAMAEANVLQTQSMMTQIEQQAAQLHQVVNTTQQTMQQVLTSQMVSADTVIQENSQVRSEANKGQQGADTIDNKPVNITRAEGQQQLQEKIRWMVNSRSTLAEIRLDPPELGSMQVRVNMSGDAASVNFVVQSQQARDALNDAMPRLREMLNEQGIELGESFVQQDQGGDGGEGADGQSAGGNGQYAGGSEDDAEVREQPLTRQETGGIDYYV